MTSAPRPTGLLVSVLGLAIALHAVAAGVVPAGAQPGVAKAPEATQAEMDAVRQRAADYWAARVARDYKAQWALSEPRLRGRTTPEDYARGKGAIEYLGYEVGDAKIDGNFATVDVKVIGRVTIAGSRAKPVVRTATVPDAWIKIEGVWYRRADQPSDTPPPQAGAKQ
jgi:hypothetical protein